MAFRRRAFQRRPRRRLFKRRGGNNIKRRLARIERVIRPKINNYKYIYQPDGQLASSIVNAGPFLQLLNGVTTGTNETNNRIGDLCRMHMLKLRLQFLRTNAAASISYNVRVLIVKEYTALGSAISLAQLFNSSTPSPRDTRNVTTRNQKRFKVYFDKEFIMGPHVSSTATTALNNQAMTDMRNVNITKRFKFVTDYSRNINGNVSDIDTNSLYLIVLTDGTTANDLQMYGGWTLSFTDS